MRGVPAARCAALRRSAFLQQIAVMSRAGPRGDIESTVAELKTRGVEFTQEVEDHGYGLVTFFKVPGDFKVQLYQPRYAK